MSRVIGTKRWNIRVDETQANGEGIVQISDRQGNKSLVMSFDGAQELAELLPVILAVNEYEEPAVPVISEST